MAGKRFEGTDKYVATDDLKIAVNAAIALERPLLIKGEPGTGKTELAFQIADAMKAPLGTVKSWVRRGLAQLRDCLEGAAEARAS